MKNFKEYSKDNIQELINIPKLWTKFKETNKNYAKAVLNYKKKMDGNLKKGKQATPAAIAAEIARSYDFDIRSFIAFLDHEVKKGNIDKKYKPGKVNKIGRFSPKDVAHMRFEETERTTTRDTIRRIAIQEQTNSKLDKLGKEFRKAVAKGNYKEADKLIDQIHDMSKDKYKTSPKKWKKSDAGKVMGKKMYEDAPTNATGPSVPGSGDTGEAYIKKAKGSKLKTFRCYDKRNNQAKRFPAMLKRPKEVK